MRKQNDEEAVEMLAQIIEVMVLDHQKLVADEVPVETLQDSLPEGPGPCPKCGAETRRRVGRNGAFYGCVNFPECRGSRNLGAEPVGPGPCPICGSPTESKVGSRGPFYGCVRYPECNGSRNFDLDSVFALPRAKPVRKKKKPPDLPTPTTPTPLQPELKATVPPLPPDLVDPEEQPFDEAEDWLFDD